MEVKSMRKMNKKGMVSILDLFLTILVIIFIFSGLYLFYNDEVEKYSDFKLSSVRNDSDIDLTSTYSNLSTQLTDIKSNSDTVINSTLQLAEVRTGPVGFIIATVDGFTATIKLMKDVLSFGLNSISILLVGIPIPPIVITFTIVLLTILFAFAILKAISGRFEL